MRRALLLLALVLASATLVACESFTASEEELFQKRMAEERRR